MRKLSIAGGLSVLVACLVAAAPACADVLETPAPRATDLAAGGGFQAWAAPTPDGRWRLTVRAPGGAVTTPAVADFGFPPNPSIGSDRLTGGRLLAVYSRCDGRSSRIGCDVYAYDLRAGAEERVGAVSTRAASETAPSLARGVFAFVRRGEGASRKGVYAVNANRRGAAPRRISPQTARETATNGSRVAYAYRSSRGGGLAVRRASGEGGVLTLASRLGPQVPRSILLSRYRASWLLFEEGDAGPRVFTTSRAEIGARDRHPRPAAPAAGHRLDRPRPRARRALPRGRRRAHGRTTAIPGPERRLSPCCAARSRCR